MTALAPAMQDPLPQDGTRRRPMRFARFVTLIAIALLVIWTAVPLFMAAMWSLVNPDDPWSPPAVLPPSLSLAQWEYVFTYSDIAKAGATSLALAPIVIDEVTIIGSRCGPFKRALEALAHREVDVSALRDGVLPLESALEGLEKARTEPVLKLLLAVDPRFGRD